MNKIIAAVLLVSSSAMFCTSAMAAGSSAGYGMGGQFSRFDPVVSQYNQSGELFRIQGHCQSACTLFLSIRNVCIERNATLLFHAGHDKARNVTSYGTNHMLGAYNAALRDYVTAHHYMDTLEFHAISGRDMIQRFGYRECPR
jgi:predicted amidophosphoribosyltransferase